jgi:hypothetical protein
MGPKSTGKKVKTDKCDYVKLGKLCTAKEIINRIKITYSLRENIYKLFIRQGTDLEYRPLKAECTKKDNPT